MAFRICDLMITTIRPLEEGRVSLEDMLRGRGGQHDAGSEIPLGVPAAPPPSRPASEIFDAPPPRGPDSENVDALDSVELRALLQLALSRLGGPRLVADVQGETVALHDFFPVHMWKRFSLHRTRAGVLSGTKSDSSETLQALPGCAPFKLWWAKGGRWRTPEI